MGFYGPEPLTNAQAYYVWTGLNEPGFFSVVVSGDAPNYTSGIQLVRDPHWVGGLKVDVMGWTGPNAPDSTPYTVRGTFPGSFLPEIVVRGSNGTRTVKVQQIPHTEVENHLLELHEAAIAQPEYAMSSS
jgi:hypothetical protein